MATVAPQKLLVPACAENQYDPHSEPQALPLNVLMNFNEHFPHCT